MFSSLKPKFWAIPTLITALLLTGCSLLGADDADVRVNDQLVSASQGLEDVSSDIRSAVDVIAQVNELTGAVGGIIATAVVTQDPDEASDKLAEAVELTNEISRLVVRVHGLLQQANNVSLSNAGRHIDRANAILAGSQ